MGRFNDLTAFSLSRATLNITVPHMGSHKELAARSHAHSDETVRLGGLQFNMSREKIASAVESHGF